MRRSNFSVHVDRRGFTLLELLVTIAIIGVLLAILLPAVQNARIAARAVQCKNRMKQVGVASQQFYDATGRYPDLFADVSWTVAFLPYLEHSGLRDEIVQAIEVDDSVRFMELGQLSIPQFNCPQSTSLNQVASGLALGSYALNFEVCVDEESAVCTDGFSNTMLATEMERNREPWIDGPVRIIEPLDSPHENFSNLLLCDGSVRGISTATDSSILEALSTPNGGEVVGEY